jgi:hypothetical protein
MSQHKVFIAASLADVAAMVNKQKQALKGKTVTRQGVIETVQ